MMRYAVIFALVLASCGKLPQNYYDDRYSGVTTEDKCQPASRITAVVLHGTFELAVYRYRFKGTITDEGELHGTAEGDYANVTFGGHIARPIFGKLFSGKITDGKCNPYVELAPPVSQ